MTKTNLEKAARDFGDETYQLVCDVFGACPNPDAEESGKYFVVDIKPISLTSASEIIGELHVTRRFCLDSAAKYLAVRSSAYKVVDAESRRPLFRYEYVRDSREIPASHIHQHDEHLMLTDLHQKAGKRKPGSVWAMHFPTGGARFRPCLEDVLQFLITEFNLDTEPNWESALEQGRENWRRVQTRAVVRDCPSDAIAILEELNYTVAPPAEGHRPDDVEKLRRW